MVAVHVKGEEKTYPVNPRKQGEAYDDCIHPDCGQRDVTPQFRLGENAAGTMGSPDRVIYHHDAKEGGCGTTWSRTRAPAIEEDHARGVQTKWGTGSAIRAAYVSVPSDRYRDNYARVFGHE